MTALALKARGRLAALGSAEKAALLDRSPPDDANVTTSVRALIEAVRSGGDEALLELASRFDGAELTALEIPMRECAAALEEMDETLRAALERAATNIATFHEGIIPDPVAIETEPGVMISRHWAPLRSAGVYAPGGRAAYPSSVLMGAIPAKSAGVEEIVLCSPPGPDGRPPAAVLAAAALAGVDRVFAAGGAGAIAAMAYGTDSIPAVDVIVGPGNRWVTEAKIQVARDVSTDGPAGPSEVLVIADETASPEIVALEMIAQAEHDPDAAAVAVVLSDEVASALEQALTESVGRAERQDVVREAFATRGAILIASSVDAAVSFANKYAPEHALVSTDDALTVAARLTRSGTVCVGEPSSVTFGDYLTGANHVLPTDRVAARASGLSTLDFLRSYTVQQVSPEGAASLAEAVGCLADAEGLPGHAAAARARARS